MPKSFGSRTRWTVPIAVLAGFCGLAGAAAQSQPGTSVVPNAAPAARAAQAAQAGTELPNAGGPTGRIAPAPDLAPGTAGASRVPSTGSVPNAATADYPTDATADYVFACMASNGDTRTALEQCSCSFDVVATLLPYERYIEASTFLSMGQVAGEKGSLFRSSEEAKATVSDLRRAQAEAEVRCFN